MNEVAKGPLAAVLELLQCPVTGEKLRQEGDRLVTASGARRYRVSASGIPLFAESHCSPEARIQQQHYDKVAQNYIANLNYPHTQEYMAFLDRAFLDIVADRPLGTVAEICCGRGEAFQLLGPRVGTGIGVDVSLSMLEAARAMHPGKNVAFVQGDATALPMSSECIDSVFMLGGIHHVNDRGALFREVSRILRPGGRFYFREPDSDFFLWRWIRAVIYRLSPALDHATERPLQYAQTVPPLEAAGLRLVDWRTEGFLGFCLFMNSDVLVFNRLFRFIPGIRALTRMAARLDAFTTQLPGMRRAGLQVIGCAEKPGGPSK